MSWTTARLATFFIDRNENWMWHANTCDSSLKNSSFFSLFPEIVFDATHETIVWSLTMHKNYDLMKAEKKKSPLFGSYFCPYFFQHFTKHNTKWAFSRCHNSTPMKCFLLVFFFFYFDKFPRDKICFLSFLAVCRRFFFVCLKSRYYFVCARPKREIITEFMLNFFLSFAIFVFSSAGSRTRSFLYSCGCRGWLLWPLFSADSETKSKITWKARNLRFCVVCNFVCRERLKCHCVLGRLLMLQ